MDHEGHKLMPPRSPGATSEVAIFGRLLEPAGQTLTPAAARYILARKFRQADLDRMRGLAAKAREGTLTPDEEMEIDSYERAGHMLSLMKSKARRALKKARRGA